MRCVCKTASAPHKSLGVLDPICKTLFEQDHPHECRGLGDHGLCHPVGVSRPNVLIPKFGIKPTPVRYRPTVVLSPTWTTYRRCSRPLQTPHAAPKYRIAVGHCRHLVGSVRYSAAGGRPVVGWRQQRLLAIRGRNHPHLREFVQHMNDLKTVKMIGLADDHQCRPLEFNEVFRRIMIGSRSKIQCDYYLLETNFSNLER